MFRGEHLISEGFMTMIYGMAGIFIVMGIIIAVIYLFGKFSKSEQ